MPDNASPVRQPAPPANSTALEREVADLIVQALNLDVAAAEIAPDAPLYGEGLGLDSIDILEIALVVSKQYGMQLARTAKRMNTSSAPYNTSSNTSPRTGQSRRLGTTFR